MSFNPSNFLRAIKKQIKNDYASIVQDGIIGDLSGFIDTGSYILNGLISGSIYKRHQS